MRFSFQHWVSFLTSLLLIGLSLVSCGNPGTTSSSDSMTLSFAQDTTTASFFTLYVAQQENFFKAQGLTLNPAPSTPRAVLGNGTKVTAAIESNSYELAGGTIADPFTLSRINAHIKILGALMDAFTDDIVVSKKFEQETGLTEASPLEDKVRALVGKKIGIAAPGTVTEAFLIYLFKQYGLNAQRDATLVSLGNAIATTGLSAMNAGRVDALSFPPPTGQIARTRGTGDILISPAHGDVPAIQNMPYTVIWAKQSVIDAKPKAIRAFIRAIAQTEVFMRQNPATMVTLLEKEYHLDPKTTAALATAMYSSYPSDPRISQQSYEVADQFHVQAGLIAVPLAYNDLVAADITSAALASVP